jgi:hypothetical protein
MMPMLPGLLLPIYGELAHPRSSLAGLRDGEAGCVIVQRAEIDWDQPGRILYDRTHAEL